MQNKLSSEKDSSGTATVPPWSQSPVSCELRACPYATGLSAPSSSSPSSVACVSASSEGSSGPKSNTTSSGLGAAGKNSSSGKMLWKMRLASATAASKPAAASASLLCEDRGARAEPNVVMRLRPCGSAHSCSPGHFSPARHKMLASMAFKPHGPRFAPLSPTHLQYVTP